MANAFQLAKRIFPDRSDDFVEHAIWGKTGFPYFPEDCYFRQALKRRKTTVRVFIHSLYKYKKALEDGLEICMMCGRHIEPSKMIGDFCLACNKRRAERRMPVPMIKKRKE